MNVIPLVSMLTSIASGLTYFFQSTFALWLARQQTTNQQRQVWVQQIQYIMEKVTMGYVK